MKLSKIFFVLLLVTFISGCANFKSIHRDLDVNNGEGALIDIKQRAIIVSKNQRKITSSDEEPVYLVCAEPSPDSMSALSASIAAEASVPDQAKLGLTASLQEGAAFVGLRTQSIQLLRDSMYRYCEMYMNGAISKSQYELLLRRNQRYMVALLAIEQLTGAVKVPTVTINSKGSAQLARNVTALIEEKKGLKEKIAENNTKISSLTTEHDADGTSDERKTEINNEKTLLVEQNKSLEKNVADIDKAIESASGSLASGSATAIVSNTGIHPSRSDAHIQTIADHVSEITQKVLDTDDLGSLCIMSLLNGELNDDSNVKSLCEKVLEASGEARLLNVDIARGFIDLASKLMLSNPDKIDKVNELLLEAKRLSGDIKVQTEIKD